MNEKISEIRKTLQAFFGEIESMAHETGFVQRLSKLTGLKFVEIWVMGFLEKPSASLNYLVQVAADMEIHITKQGLQDRLSRGSIKLMAAVLAGCSRCLRNKVPMDLQLLKPFQGLQIVDSSGFGLPDNLQNEFPGTGGDGPKSSMKLQTIWDFLHGNLLEIVVQTGTQSDQAFREHLKYSLPGWLCLSDLGYFTLEAIETMIAQQAYFISRWLNGCGLVEPATQTKFDLLSYLQSTTHDKLELNLWMGFQNKLPCRLLAVRLPPQAVASKRRKANASARRKGRTLSATSLAWLEWNVFVTNVPETWLSLEQVTLIYRLRWQIELLFKLWKSECQIDQIAGSTQNRVLCEIYAKVIGAVLFQYISAPLRSPEQELSPVKALQTFRRFAIPLAQALQDAGRLDILLSTIFAVWQRCGLMENRPTRLSTCQQIARAGVILA